jgi:dTDP-4-amino-4,6-dideoxygalactose transaminase
MSKRIPLVDLVLQHQQVGDEVLRGWDRVLERSEFVLGPESEAFEQEYAAFTGIPYCVGVGSGTDALELALRSVGIGLGDQVIVPTNSFVASAFAVRRSGATPVLVDVDPEHLLIDPEAVDARVSPSTRAVMAVHLFGQMAPMAAISQIAARSEAFVIEDAAQAQGATQGGVSAGGFGAVTGTSFYPGKNLGAYGDAGAVLTGDATVAARVRALRNYGIGDSKYEHPVSGFNSRLDALQAVVLRAKLRHLDEWNRDRQEAVARYDALLRDIEEVHRPHAAVGNEHVWHLYVVRVSRRDDVLRFLNERGVGAGVHYPKPIHLQGAFAELGYQSGDFPVAERAAQEVLSLPIYPGITVNQQEIVIETLRKALR